jgi:RNA polymerase sigma factor (sigma-70 family)
MEDKEVINEILGGDYSYIYGEVYDTCIALSRKKGVYDIDWCGDIFQNAVTAFFLNITNGDFKLTSKVKTYFVSIYLNHFHKELKRDKVTLFKDGEEERFLSNDVVGSGDVELISDIIDEVVNTLTESQQKIIYYTFFDKIPNEKIADKFGFSNAASVKAQKYKLMKKMEPRLRRRFKHHDLLEYIN